MLLVYRVSGTDRGAVVPPLRSSQLCHHLVDLAVVDAGAIPFHTVWGLLQVAPDLTLNHATHELLKGGFPIGTVGHTCFGGVVEEFVILNPEGDIPGFVVGPTVVVECHGFGSFVDVISIEGQRCPQRA
jgi:hypothetical protein